MIHHFNHRFSTYKGEARKNSEGNGCLPELRWKNTRFPFSEATLLGAALDYVSRQNTEGVGGPAGLIGLGKVANKTNADCNVCECDPWTSCFDKCLHYAS